MTLDEFLPLLQGVRARGQGRWAARCPAHDDRTPSLSISEGERGILLRCFPGCSLPAICESLGIRQNDLFFDALDPDPHKRKAAAQQRDRQRQQQAEHARKQGRRLDALREADYHIRSRRGIDISGWSDQRLDDELSVLADAYTLLESEERDG